jgi:hypothetical protein
MILVIVKYLAELLAQFQSQIVNIDSASSISIYSLATVGVTYQISMNQVGFINQNQNTDGFQQTVTAWTQVGSGPSNPGTTTVTSTTSKPTSTSTSISSTSTTTVKPTSTSTSTTATPTSTGSPGGNCGSIAAWTSAVAYVGGQQVTYGYVLPKPTNPFGLRMLLGATCGKPNGGRRQTPLVALPGCGRILGLADMYEYMGRDSGLTVSHELERYKVSYRDDPPKQPGPPRLESGNSSLTTIWRSVS